LSTLPVAALGVGIGVDYGIYILNGLRIANRRGRSFEKCYESALARSGAAVLLTGLTLAVGVSTWYFSKLQFQADMGILLAFMFIANMIGALVFIPILARLTGLYVPQPKLTGDQEV
ncbi:RND family transporter, partial [bacterium]|nr:RND family transporter [bacterium]